MPWEALGGAEPDHRRIDVCELLGSALAGERVTAKSLQQLQGNGLLKMEQMSAFA